MEKFDNIVLGAMEIGQAKALDGKNGEIFPEHLLWGLLKNPQSFTAQNLSEHLPHLQELLDKLPTVGRPVSLQQLRVSPRLQEWLTHANAKALQDGHGEVKESDLLRFLPRFFPNLGIDPQIFSNSSEDGSEEVPFFLNDLNRPAREGKLDPVIGRSKEIRSVIEILGRRRKNNPVLTGPAGVGKTAIVEGLADAIVKGSVPDLLQDKTIYALDMGALVAGSKHHGEFEERLMTLLKFMKKRAGSAILFIDEMHLLVGAGKTNGAMDAANLLKPALARGELNCIGATTEDEYQKFILGDAALDRRFRQVPVLAPSKEDAIEILMGIREKWEAHHGIKISDEAIFSAVFLSEQYITDKNLPDKAIDLIDEASSALKLSAETMPPKLVELEGKIRSKKVLSQVEPNNQAIKEEIVAMEEKFVREKKTWEKEIFSVKRMSELKNQIGAL